MLQNGNISYFNPTKFVLKYWTRNRKYFNVAIKAITATPYKKSEHKKSIERIYGLSIKSFAYRRNVDTAFHNTQPHRLGKDKIPTHISTSPKIRSHDY